MDTKKTGLLISQARKEQGLTQKELAEQLHVSDRTVSKWERGAGFPDVTLLEPISDTLGLPVQCLLLGTRELNAPATQTDKAIRDAVRDIYVLCRNKTRRNISTILAGAVRRGSLRHTGL